MIPPISRSRSRRYVLDPDTPTATFELVRVRRAKAKRGHAGKVQKFIVPEPMRPVLRAWHVLQGCPKSGPVFPVTKGKRAGQHRVERGTSYAHRLRRELWRMGIRDHAIHNDTQTSKRVDWHSFRRAFATSLAVADIGEQRAMHLTAHSDSKVHARYVQETPAMQVIPDAAVSLLPANFTGSGHRGVRTLSPRDRNPLEISTPGKIRTYDIRLRRPTLYPAELRAQVRRSMDLPQPSPAADAFP